MPTVSVTEKAVDLCLACTLVGVCMSSEPDSSALLASHN